jgi:hypothetical protein
MDSGDYRQHAKLCRHAAARSTEPIRGDFLAAADIWDMLARQWDFLVESTAKDIGSGHSETDWPHRVVRR